MTICYFGMYARSYTRNRILMSGLKKLGINIIECNDRSHLLWGLRYLRLLKKFLQVKGYKSDIIFVGFPGQTDVPLAWILGKVLHKKIIFDAFFSLYVSQIYDRKHASEKSLKSKGYFLIEWLSCILADRIILDTNAHIDYFSTTFHISKEKFARVLVGTDTDILKPQPVKKNSRFIVGFHGSYLPLQGIPIILQAAQKLQKENIQFSLLGNGLELAKCQQFVSENHLKNVEFLKEVPYDKLPDFIATTDIYLGGPFAATLKASQVIPNKVYEAMAMKKAVIVGKSPATEEIFTDKVHCLFVSQGNPQDLADAILLLRKNNSLREKISLGGYNLIHSKLTPEKVAEELIKAINTT